MAAVVTLKEVKSGKFTLRLVRVTSGFAGLIVDGAKVERIDGDDADDVWRKVHDAAGRMNPSFIGYSSARSRFLNYFPDGFPSGYYVAQERKYKLDAKARLELAAPLATAATVKGAGEAALSAFNTNLVDRFAKMRVRDVLRGPDSNAFVNLAAAFALAPGSQTLKRLAALLKPHGCAKWTVVTYLPFLWRPDAHFFLKPEMLTQFAERVGHPFAEIYRPDLDFEVYEALLDMANTTLAKVADMGPRDFIDVQSFMWTVIEYRPEDRPKFDAQGAVSF